MSASGSGRGMILGIHAGADETSGATYTPVAEVTKITPPTYSREVVDLTSADSSEEYEEVIGGVRRTGKVQIEGKLTTAGRTALLAAFDRNDNDAFQITLPDYDGGAIQFSGFLSDFSSSLTFSGECTFSAQIKVSGKPTEISTPE